MDQSLEEWVNTFLRVMEEVTKLTWACRDALVQLDMAALEEAQRARAQAIERLGVLGNPPGPLPADLQEIVQAAAREAIAVDARVMEEMETTLSAVQKLLEEVSEGQAIRGYSPEETPRPRFVDKEL
ncbi:MAG: hypothetical protein QN198_03585 [Armatimonadota bacterium]|nr:hypothetical protein [Armatimonadota bacterium]MDR5702664.1 hypothetical protein [Armatimonadota bacterium]